MIIAPKELLRDAQERHYAIPAFNFYNLDGLFAVLEAAEEEQAPIIVEIYHVYFCIKRSFAAPFRRLCAPLASMHICIWITPLTNRF